MEICLQRAQENVQYWKAHEETEEERRVYVLADGAARAITPSDAS